MDVDTEVDSNFLSTDEVNKIQEMIDKSNFFNLPAKAAPPERGADYFEYKITVETKDGKHTIETTDFTMPYELKPLVKYLRSYLKSKSK